MTTQRNDQHVSEPVACTLTNDDLKTQRERWVRLWREAGHHRVETEDGVRLVFARQPGVADELRSLVAVENECCSWARWTVSIDGDDVFMDARSRGEGTAVLRRMFADNIPAEVPSSDR